MARESAEAKGLRYLCEGRLIVTVVTPRAIAAECRGAGQIYALGWDGCRGWWCDCPAKATCSHLVALQRVTALGGRREAGGKRLARPLEQLH